MARSPQTATRRSPEKLPPIHPGEILRDDFLEPTGLTVRQFAEVINISSSRARNIVRGRQAVTTDTALRLARCFGTSAQFWLNLQARYDLEVADDRNLPRRIEKEVIPIAAVPGTAHAAWRSREMQAI